MISKPTVLVLGAGSSTHCGYPLGRELVAQLCQLRGSAELDNLPDGWSRDGVERFLTKLSLSDPSSIDAFLETNRDEASLGKFLIARQLKKRGVAQLASSWVPSTRNFKPSIDERTALNSIERHSNVSWACGPRLEASRAIPQE